MENFEYLELSELRKLLDEKKVSSLELTEYFLKRIESINPKLNAYLTVCSEEAREDAKRADAYIAAPGENPLLCGIPYAAKDLFLTRGIRTTASSRILENYIAPYDATAVVKVKEQYGVLLGKTNLDEFAHGSSTETSAFGSSRNPWDLSRNPGGSSGGSSSAVSAGIAPWSLATETGGSIRQPASLTGTSGWKPTYGRVSRYGVIAMASSLDSIGVIGNSVRDLAMLASVISGKDDRDSTTGSVEVGNYYRNIDTNVKGVKIGVPEEYFVSGMEEGVRKAIEAGIEKYREMGAEIVPVSLPLTKYGSLVYAIICPSEVSSNLMRYDGIRYGHISGKANTLAEVYAKSRGEGFGDEAKRRVMTGTYVLSAGYYDAYYKKAQKVRRLILNEFIDVFKKVDLLACASTPNVALPIGEAKDNPLFGYIADQLNIPSSLAGLPGISMPCGFSKPTTGADQMNDMPVGLQLIGPQWSEQLLFNVGVAYQDATEHHKRHPNIE